MRRQRGFWKIDRGVTTSCQDNNSRRFSTASSGRGRTPRIVRDPLNGGNEVTRRIERLQRSGRCRRGRHNGRAGPTLTGPLNRTNRNSHRPRRINLRLGLSGLRRRRRVHQKRNRRPRQSRRPRISLPEMRRPASSHCRFVTLIPSRCRRQPTVLPMAPACSPGLRPSRQQRFRRLPLMPPCSRRLRAMEIRTCCRQKPDKAISRNRTAKPVRFSPDQR